MATRCTGTTKDANVNAFQKYALKQQHTLFKYTTKTFVSVNVLNLRQTTATTLEYLKERLCILVKSHAHVN